MKSNELFNFNQYQPQTIQIKKNHIFIVETNFLGFICLM